MTRLPILLACQYIDLNFEVSLLSNKIINRVSDTLQQLVSWYYIIFMIQMYIISINIFIYSIIKVDHVFSSSKIQRSRIIINSMSLLGVPFEDLLWLIKRLLEPILPTRKTKWLLFSEKLWKSDSIYFNPRRWSQNCFKEFQKWVMFRVIHALNDFLTPVDLRSQTFGIKSELLTYDHGHIRKFVPRDWP